MITRLTVQACCGGTAIIFKTDFPLTKSFIEQFVAIGYKELAQFTKSGILYVENSDFVLNGPLGSDKLTVRCKVKNCSQLLNELEDTINKFQ